MFDLAIDSKLRGCDVVKIKIGDLVSGGRVRSRAIVVQQKTGRPVQFELLEPTRGSILVWLERRGGALDEFVFPSRLDHADHISTRQYARLVDEWVTGIGLHPEDYGTHSPRRTKASIIYKQTGNLRAVQILLGHTKIESTGPLSGR
jgi:integrase